MALVKRRKPKTGVIAEWWLMRQFERNQWLYVDSDIPPAWMADTKRWCYDEPSFQRMVDQWEWQLAYHKQILAFRYPLLITVQDEMRLDTPTKQAWYIKILNLQTVEECEKTKGRLNRYLTNLEAQGYFAGACKKKALRKMINRKFS